MYDTSYSQMAEVRTHVADSQNYVMNQNSYLTQMTQTPINFDGYLYDYHRPQTHGSTQTDYSYRSNI